MNKKLFALVSTVIVLSLLVMPALAAQEKVPDGIWSYNSEFVNIRVVGGNMFISITDVGMWSGTFEGTSDDVGEVAVYRSGLWNYWGTVEFTGEVDGVSGTLTMKVHGIRPDADSEWDGTWVIISGTGGLATLRGQGTWWGMGAPGPGVWGDVEYEGDVHFEP